MTDEMQLEALYGKAAKFSEYKAGQTVRYRDNGRELIGEITYVSAPGHTVRGVAHPTQYWIDGLTCIYQTDIICLVNSDACRKDERERYMVSFIQVTLSSFVELPVPFP